MYPSAVLKGIFHIKYIKYLNIESSKLKSVQVVHKSLIRGWNYQTFSWKWDFPLKQALLKMLWMNTVCSRRLIWVTSKLSYTFRRTFDHTTSTVDNHVFYTCFDSDSVCSLGFILTPAWTWHMFTWTNGMCWLVMTY